MAGDFRNYPLPNYWENQIADQAIGLYRVPKAPRPAPFFSLEDQGCYCTACGQAIAIVASNSVKPWPADIHGSIGEPEVECDAVGPITTRTIRMARP